MEPLRVVLSGIDGIGAIYLNALLDRAAERGLALTGVIQPGMEHHPREAGWLQMRSIPVADSLHTYFHQLKGTADLVIVASPAQYHFEQCYEALWHGCHVLCEQPAVSDYRHALTLEALAQSSGLTLAVGFPDCYCDAMIRLKQDVMQGRYGKALSMRSLTLVGHSDLYYKRSGWAGRFFDSEGRSVQDGVMHNGAANQLHTMLYLMGSDLDTAADIEVMRGEWCKARSIASYDTAAVRLQDKSGTVLTCCASHAWAGKDTGLYRYVWEHGYAEGDWVKDKRLTVRTQEEVVDYGEVTDDPVAKLTMVADCIREGRPVPCSIRAAKAEVAVCNGLYQSAGRVNTLSLSELQLVRGATGTVEEGGVYASAPRVTELLRTCFTKGCLPCDLGEPLSGQPKTVTMADISHGIPGEN